jgi:hypothetical protein
MDEVERTITMFILRAATPEGGEERLEWLTCRSDWRDWWGIPPATLDQDVDETVAQPARAKNQARALALCAPRRFPGS